MLARAAVLQLRDRTEDGLLSYSDAARVLGVTTKTVQRMVVEGRLSRVVPAVGRPQITYASLLAAQCRPATADARGHRSEMSPAVLYADKSGRSGSEADIHGLPPTEADNHGRGAISATVPLVARVEVATPDLPDPVTQPFEDDALYIPLHGLTTDQDPLPVASPRARVPRRAIRIAAAAFLLVAGGATVASRVLGQDRSTELVAAMPSLPDMSATVPSTALSSSAPLARKPRSAAERIEQDARAAQRAAERRRAQRRAEARRKAAARTEAERKRRARAAAAAAAAERETTAVDPAPAPVTPDPPTADPGPSDPPPADPPSECSAIYGGIGLC